MKIKIFKLDAFTKNLFSGNPAGVCILNNWLDGELMQSIAKENNLSETAFIVEDNKKYQIRWFTPMEEVELCGHATLASAYVLFNELKVDINPLEFYSHLSGKLSVTKKENGLFELNFPTDIYSECAVPDKIGKSMNKRPIECYKGKTDYMLVYSSQKEVEDLSPDYRTMRHAEGRGVIATAVGDNCDFVSRFFASQCGIDEDPATGSAHTTLIPYWAKKLDKNRLKSLQLSERGGYFECTFMKDRVLIAGSVVLYLKGEIFI